jgi:hypothetical protein
MFDDDVQPDDCSADHVGEHHSYSRDPAGSALVQYQPRPLIIADWDPQTTRGEPTPVNSTEDDDDAEYIVPAHARMHPHPETAVVAVPPLISVVQLSWGNVTQTSPGVPGPFLVQDYSQNENEIGRRRQAPHSPSNGDGFFCKCGYKTEKAGDKKKNSCPECTIGKLQFQCALCGKVLSATSKYKHIKMHDEGRGKRAKTVHSTDQVISFVEGPGAPGWTSVILPPDATTLPHATNLLPVQQQPICGEYIWTDYIPPQQQIPPGPVFEQFDFADQSDWKPLILSVTPATVGCKALSIEVKAKSVPDNMVVVCIYGDTQRELLVRGRSFSTTTDPEEVCTISLYFTHPQTPAVVSIAIANVHQRKIGNLFRIHFNAQVCGCITHV